MQDGTMEESEDILLFKNQKTPTNTIFNQMLELEEKFKLTLTNCLLRAVLYCFIMLSLSHLSVNKVALTCVLSIFSLTFMLFWQSAMALQCFVFANTVCGMMAKKMFLIAFKVVQDSYKPPARC